MKPRSIILALTLIAAASTAWGQREAGVVATNNFQFESDQSAAKMLGAARDFIAAQQWSDAIDLLRQAADQFSDHLVPVESGRYTSVQGQADLMLSGLPPEALALYRAKIDPQAQRWFELAAPARDVEGLEKIVRRAFLSSVGDDALLLLGDLAWERRALAQARGYWEKLIPTAGSRDVPKALLLLRYPDSPLPREMIAARLIMCRLAEGQLQLAREELTAFRNLYPEARGRLAGQPGVLAVLLQEQLEQAIPADSTPAVAENSTFAENSSRNPTPVSEFAWGAPLWSIPLPETRVDRSGASTTGKREGGKRWELPVQPQFNQFPEAFPPRAVERGPAMMPMRVLGTFPVSWHDKLFYCDETCIYGVDLSREQAGKPVWDDDYIIYRLPRELALQTNSERGRIGSPIYTLTIAGDLLFARLGSLSTPSSQERDLRPGANALVCLDLLREGDLKWSLTSEIFNVDGGKWIFDGPPTVANGYVYVVLRCHAPQMQLNVACFDIAEGKLLWNRKVCTAVEALGGDFGEIRCQLLSLVDDRLFLNTNFGAIAAIDARNGSPLWVASYPHSDVESVAAFQKRQQYVPNPCLVDSSLVFAAPSDAEEIFAFDAETGIMKWRSPHRGRPPQLLGLADGKLICAGNTLSAINALSGRVEWRVGESDPAAATSGRGMISQGLVYWPRRDEILFIDLATGNRAGRIPLGERYGFFGGGNLTLAGPWMIYARSNSIVGFSEFGGEPFKSSSPITLH